MTPGPIRTALPAALASALAVAILAAGCDRAEHRPPPPVCGAFQVAEYDDDDWECEPDANRNGVDDEDDEKKRRKATPTRSARPRRS